MSDYAECVQCGTRRPGGTWQPGEVCLFGTLFACSLECAKKWAAENAAPGYRPGEPGFWYDEEPHREQCSDCGAEILGAHGHCPGVPGGFGDDQEATDE